jgi:hypothetical protein
MASLAPFDPKARGREARVRALLEDLVRAHIEGRPMIKMVLAVWYRKTPGSEDQFLLELINYEGFNGFDSRRLSLLWKSGSEGQPYANVKVTSVDYFLNLLAQHPEELAEYYDGDFEVLYFDKAELARDPSTARLLELFRIVTEPPGLMKGWYVTEAEYDKSSTLQALLSRRGGGKPELGLVKAWESENFEHCRGILHIEIAGRWLPFSSEGVRSYAYYADMQSGRRAYLIFEGGALYEVLRFEVKTAPEYALTLGLLEAAPDDRYPEVYLRAVRPPARTTA